MYEREIDGVDDPEQADRQTERYQVSRGKMLMDDGVRLAGESQREWKGKRRKEDRKGEEGDRADNKKEAERGGADCLWPDLGWCWAASFGATTRSTYRQRDT